MGNYQCYKCGIPGDHSYIDKRHLMRKHCREHSKEHNKKNTLICKDCDGYKDNLGCYHNIVFVWWCNKIQVR